MHGRGSEFYPRQLIFLKKKITALGELCCVALPCLSKHLIDGLSHVHFMELGLKHARVGLV